MIHPVYEFTVQKIDGHIYTLNVPILNSHNLDLRNDIEIREYWRIYIKDQNDLDLLSYRLVKNSLQG